MSFPISGIFQGLKGLVNVTITADSNGAPELIHLADEAGNACAHFVIDELDLLGQHIEGLLHLGTHGATVPADLENAGPASTRQGETVAVPVGGQITDPLVTSTAPFLEPAADTAPAAAEAARAETPQDAEPKA